MEENPTRSPLQQRRRSNTRPSIDVFIDDPQRVIPDIRRLARVMADLDCVSVSCAMSQWPTLAARAPPAHAQCGRGRRWQQTFAHGLLYIFATATTTRRSQMQEGGMRKRPSEADRGPSTRYRWGGEQERGPEGATAAARQRLLTWRRRSPCDQCEEGSRERAPASQRSPSF